MKQQKCFQLSGHLLRIQDEFEEPLILIGIVWVITYKTDENCLLANAFSLLTILSTFYILLIDKNVNSC